MHASRFVVIFNPRLAPRTWGTRICVVVSYATQLQGSHISFARFLLADGIIHWQFGS